jgi:hypothetical protein
VLVRGPRAAYVELIAAGSGDSNPWLDRIRSARGPISWAVAVDDIEAAREALVAAGFDPDPAVPGSRRTPAGDVLEWTVCDAGGGPYDDSLPFLIQWTTPMPAGPADGPVLEWISLTPPDPDRVAALLEALGFVGDRHFPRRVFRDHAGVSFTLNPLGEPEHAEEASWFMAWDDDDVPATSLSLAVPHPESSTLVLDQVQVTTRPDRRRFAASALLPAVDEAFARLRGSLADWPNPHPDGAPPLEEEYSRATDPERYRLLGVRADAWIEVLTARGLGTAETKDPDEVAWVGDIHGRFNRVTVLRGRTGTQPVTVGCAPSQSADEAFLQVGVGEPAHVLESQPDCGCDACDTGSADLLETVDSAFILALGGGVYVVREGSKVVTRSLDGWGGTGLAGDEAERWLAEAAERRRTEGVVSGVAWL